MKLRLIVFLISLSITLGFTAGLIGLFHRVFLASYAQLEQNHLRADVQRLSRALDAEVQSLDRTLQDYATWDVTYALIRRPDPRFAKSELAPTTMRNLDLRTALIGDPNGNIVFAQTNRNGSTVPETTVDRRTMMQLLSGLAENSNASIKGIVSLSDGPVLVAVRPVLTTEAVGPTRGAMLMSRDFDRRLTARLSNLLEVPVVLKDLERESADPSLVAEVQDNGNFAFRAINRDRALGFKLVDDLNGTPRYLLSIEHDRSIWNAGNRAERTLALSIFSLGLVFCFCYVWVVTSKVIKPVEAMIEFTRLVGRNKDLQARMHVRGRSELSQLALQINAMLDEIRDSNQKLLAARERLQYEATHDALTGAWNHAAALELLDRELARCSRDHTTIAVILIDADHFKSINDRFGHQAGDAVLQQITVEMGKNLRGSDVLARYGGEEFVIIAPNCTLNEGRALASRILANLAKTQIHVGEQTIHVTVSAGVAAAGAPFSSEDLIAVADRAMYRAKERGRNRIEVEELTSETVIRGSLYAMPRRLV